MSKNQKLIVSEKEMIERLQKLFNLNDDMMCKIITHFGHHWRKVKDKIIKGFYRPCREIQWLKKGDQL